MSLVSLHKEPDSESADHGQYSTPDNANRASDVMALLLGILTTARFGDQIPPKVLDKGLRGKNRGQGLDDGPLQSVFLINRETFLEHNVSFRFRTHSAILLSVFRVSGTLRDNLCLYQMWDILNNELP